MATSPEISLQEVDPSERVEHHIRHAVTGVDDGGRLPSVRELMRRCNATKSAVERALSRLQGEGLVESRARSGLYRIGGTSIRESVVEYLYFGHPEDLLENHFHSDLFSCLSSVLAQHSKFIRLTVMKREKALPAVVDRLIRAGSGTVVTCNVGMNDIFDISRLPAAGIPVLHLLPNFTEPIDESLILDDEAIVRLQIEHLVDRGYRKVAYLHATTGEEYIRALNARRDAFLRLSIDYGLELRPGWVINTTWQPEPIVNAIGPLLRASVRPEALVINDGAIRGVYSAIRSCGLVPGRDIGVIGCDDMPWAAHVDPPLTTVRVSRPAIATIVRNLLVRQAAGEKTGRTSAPPELIARESTAPRGQKKV